MRESSDGMWWSFRVWVVAGFFLLPVFALSLGALTTPSGSAVRVTQPGSPTDLEAAWVAFAGDGTNDAIIIVTKQTLPAGTTELFDFTGDLAGALGDGQSLVLEGLAAGSYYTTEDVATGWRLESILCDDYDSYGDVANRTANYALQAGEVVTCTFINTHNTLVIFVDDFESGTTDAWSYVVGD